MSKNYAIQQLLLQGVALICRPGAASARQRDVDTIRAVLRKEIGLTVVELESDQTMLNASDLLFTGKEFFVGLGKETNMEGRTFLYVNHMYRLLYWC